MHHFFCDLELANTTIAYDHEIFTDHMQSFNHFYYKIWFTQNLCNFFNNDLEFANLNLGQVYDTTSGHFYVRYESPIFLHKKSIDRTQILNLFFSMTMNLLKWRHFSVILDIYIYKGGTKGVWSEVKYVIYLLSYEYTLWNNIFISIIIC